MKLLIALIASSVVERAIDLFITKDNVNSIRELALGDKM